MRYLIYGFDIFYEIVFEVDSILHQPLLLYIRVRALSGHPPDAAFLRVLINVLSVKIRHETLSDKTVEIEMSAAQNRIYVQRKSAKMMSVSLIYCTK